MSLFEDLVQSLSSLGLIGLIVVSFFEASIFPVPPDVFLIPLVLVDSSNAIWYGLASTISSAFGALLGYFIGLKLGRPIVEKFLKPSQIMRAERIYQKYGLIGIAIAAFSPIPFKAFTLTSGLLRFNRLPVYFIVCLLGRAARLVPEAILVGLWGDEAIMLIEENIVLFSIIGVIIVIATYALYRYITTRQREELYLDSSSRSSLSLYPGYG
ncbi:MAG: VTT domain-containing protein [Nitrososphaeria archaeon]|nr:VTT domain-containing protein [Nitrososphaeria archaeon]MDW7986750.1 VTT domain-containing protein [Nitrososphaerota archaeon]